MKTFSLIRDKEIGDATLGYFQAQDGRRLCETLEEQWVDANGDGIGDRGKSRIPAGSYICRRHKSPSHGGAELWQICNVPGRTFILIHAGNSTADTEGCVLVGTGRAAGLARITESKKALALFHDWSKGEKELLLNVKDIGQ